MFLQYGKLRPTNRFWVLPCLLQRRSSPEANQTLHDVWSSPGLVHYIYISGGSCPLTEFCQVQNSLHVQILRSPLLHGTPAAGVSQTLRRGTRNGITDLSHIGRHLYSAGRPARWASAHTHCASAHALVWADDMHAGALQLITVWHLKSLTSPAMGHWNTCHSTSNNLIVRLHRSATYVDVACCYRPNSVVCWSVCLSVCLSVSPAITAEPIQMPFGFRTLVGQGNHVLDGVQIPPCEGAIFGEKSVPL